MTTSRNGKWQLWLASFLATGVVWTYFVSRASAQNAVTITINNSILTRGDQLSIPGQSNSGSILLTPGDSIQNIGNGGNISLNAESIRLVSVPKASDTSSAQNIGNGGNISVNRESILILRTKASDTSSAQSIGNGGNISINANSIRLVSVAEPSHTSGILVFAVLSVASALKRKQKNGAGFKPHD